MIRFFSPVSSFLRRAFFLVALLAMNAMLQAQTVNPPPPPGGGGGGGGNPDGPLDPLIPFDSTMNIVFLSLGVAFAVYVMIRRKKENNLAKSA